MSIHSDVPGEEQRAQAASLLHAALMASLTAEKQQWLSSQLAELLSGSVNRRIDMAFGLSPRRIGSHTVTLSGTQREQLSTLIPQWQANRLEADMIARFLIINACRDAEHQSAQIARLLRHADLREQLALYKALPLYTPSAALNDLLADGLRSNMKDVFEAIAHNNPYAAWHLDTHRFNHMVLKALFIDSRLSPIAGLAERNNPELARMLLDFARERQAASRPVSDELWRFARPYMSEKDKQLMQQEKAS